MKMVFPVLWRKLFKTLSIYISVGIIIPVSVFMIFRIVKLGYAETFRIFTPFSFFLLLIGIVAFASLSALTISLLVKLAKISIEGDYIEGRNFWGLKKKLPLKGITSLSKFSSHGLNAIIVSSKNHGEIYIMEPTANLNELLALLTLYIDEKKA